MRKGRNASITLGIKPWLDLDINNPLPTASIACGWRIGIKPTQAAQNGHRPSLENGLAEMQNPVAEITEQQGSGTRQI